MPDADAAAPVDTMADLVGRVFNARYRVLRKVGAGSMGDVYESQRLADGRAIAIKVLKPEHAVREVFRHRFLREAKATVPIDHPNVVDVLDFGLAEGGWLYIAMEFLEGEDLAAYLARLGRLSWRQTCALLQQAASGLAAAHAHGVVHRDVKPSNVLLVDDRAGGARVKIVDFGVAKLAGQAVSRVLTQVDDVVGTVAYMSPEQAEGREADLRSDIYALGVTAYECATGEVPFAGRDMFQVMMGHLERAPTPPCELVPDFPPAANAFILRCLAKRPEARFQNMDEVLAMLQNAASPDAVPLPPPVLLPERRSVTSVGPAPAGPGAPARPGADTFDEEAPTGYFFRPVLPSAPPRTPPSAPTQQPPAPSGRARPSFTVPVPTLPPSGRVAPVAVGGAARGPTVRTPSLASNPVQAELSGGTMRVPSVETPVIDFDDSEFERPAGQMSVATLVVVLMLATLLVAGVAYAVAAP